jgi:hypothetical protein
MNTVERIHAYCHNASTLRYDEDIYLQDTQKLIEEPISSQLVINNNISILTITCKTNLMKR